MTDEHRATARPRLLAHAPGTRAKARYSMEIEMKSVMLGILGAAIGAAVLASPARADEAKSLINASTILTIVAPPPIESRSSAYDRSLRDEGVAPRKSPFEG